MTPTATETAAETATGTATGTAAAPHTSAIIATDRLSFTYAAGTRPALDDINLQVAAGDFVGIIGPSGAGKSTLAAALSGVIPHYWKGSFYGAVRVDGRDSCEQSLTDISRTVATVFQDIEAQMVAAIVEDEVLFGLENFGVPKADIPGRVTDALDLVGIADLRRRTISSLSGGQRQKVALAAALALRPRVLLLDEPTSELDPASSVQIFETLQRLNREQGITVIVIEQKIMLLCAYARTLGVMDGGRLVHHGPVRTVLEHIEDLETRGVNAPRVTTFTHALRRAVGAGLPLTVTVDETESALRRAFSGAANDTTHNTQGERDVYAPL
ncbi:MAG: ATP-binding cassette domain-containing protein [Actinomycetes bacterium]|nr:ATP-binding cassette domain-containing protein [Actinomycetes bacterium]